MSLYIKEMDMPKEGESIIMVLEPSGKVISRLLRDSGTKAIALADKQAVEIPTPHGRIIDASELDKCWEEKEDISEDVDYKILYKCVLAISKYAPTILEAER